VTEPDDANEFGTPAFYAAIGRAFVAMCAVVPFLFLVEAIDQLTGHALDRDGGIIAGQARGLDGIIFSRSCTRALPTCTPTPSRSSSPARSCWPAVPSAR